MQQMCIFNVSPEAKSDVYDFLFILSSTAIVEKNNSNDRFGALYPELPG